MSHRHLSDSRLVALCLDSLPAARELEHLHSCAACEARRAGFARVLADSATAAAEEADAAFPAERLARQEARILQRVEQDGRPARVIAFPAGQPHEPSLLRSRPGMRWIAGAAAAGLVIGILAGHLAHDFSLAAPRGAAAAQATRPTLTAPPRQTTMTALGEEEFLGRIERAVQRSSGPALRPLDDLTPLVGEVAAR